MTRQDKTSNPIVQQHTSNHPTRVIVIGNIHAVINAVSSIADSKNYVCTAAIVENYAGGKTFLRYISGLKLTAKLKMILQAVRTSRSVRKFRRKALRKVPAVYFTATENLAATFKLIPRDIFDNADLFLLSCKDDNTSRNSCLHSDYAASLMRMGISKDRIFVLPFIMHNAQLPIIVNEKLSIVCKNLADVKPVLRYMEYHVTDFCNLKCKGCGHLANRVTTLEFAGADKFRAALEKLREKFENITVMRIMGGEPLLCSTLHDYINAAHEVFPYSEIKIVTNGLLFRNITPLTIEAIRNACAEIQVSLYPPSKEIAEQLIAFCEEKGIRLLLGSPITEFFKRDFREGDTDIRENWLACESRYCHFLHGTTFYPCPHVWSNTEPRFQEFITRRTISDSELKEFSYDLTQEIAEDGWDILSKFEVPMSICSKCGKRKVFFTWESEAASK